MFLFYKDFNKEGGVPLEIRNFKLELEKNGVQIEVVTKFSEQLFSIIFRKEQIVFVGFFFPRYLFFWLIMGLFKRNYIIWPIGQISRYSINKNIFTKSPIIEKLNSQTESIQKKSTIKPLFIKLSKICFFLKKPSFWVFSEYEKDELSYFFKVNSFQKVYWVIGQHLKKHVLVSQKRTDKAQILLCWSRIDVESKGIDRFSKLSYDLKSEKYKSFVCGPYYSGNVNNYNNQNNFEIIDTLRNNSQNIEFLDANFIVLLSRWDGFPRVLREAVLNKIPIIISEETHFKELVEEYQIGLVYSEDEDIDFERKLENYDKKTADFEGAIIKINRGIIE